MKITEEQMNERTFGCELEYEGIAQDRAAKVVATITGGEATWRGTHLNNWEVKMPDGRVWQVGSDGSLCGTSAEVVTPILRHQDLPMLQEVVRGLRKAHARVSERTGLHVHVGIADFTPENIKNLVRTYYKQEKIIAKAMGTLQRRMARYTRETDPAFVERICNLRHPTMNDINTAWFGRLNLSPYHYDEHRYRLCNLNNLWGANAKKTVEFRGFNGSLHAGEIKCAVELSLLICIRAKAAKASSAKNQRKANEANQSDRYKMRCFLLRLGAIGSLFKTTRFHLQKRLEGSAAWLNGRPAPSANATPEANG